MRAEVSEERGLSKPWKNFTLRKNVEVVQNCGEGGGHGDAKHVWSGWKDKPKKTQRMWT